MKRPISPVSQQLKLSLGDIVFSLISDSSLNLTVSQAHKVFFVSEGEPDIILEAEFGAVPPLELEEEVFRTEEVWRLYWSRGKWLLYFRDFRADEHESTPYKVAILEPDFSYGKIHSRIKESEEENYFNPLNYPLDELLVVNLLSRGKGILVHACAVVYQGQGWLFLGTSGAGKSTLTELWKGEPGVTLLSDDRIIIRDMGDSYRIYGTPWHGNAEIASPLSAPLNRIFFLAHDHENRLTPVQRVDAASRLLVRSFPTFWDAEGMQYTLGLCERLSARVPCHELGFIPDKHVIGILRNLA
ncbi:hypothetical protein ACFLUU_02380 [Chloroflexota bacterium]